MVVIIDSWKSSKASRLEVIYERYTKYIAQRRARKGTGPKSRKHSSVNTPKTSQSTPGPQDVVFQDLPFVKKIGKNPFVAGRYSLPPPKYLEIDFQKLVEGCFECEGQRFSDKNNRGN